MTMICSNCYIRIYKSLIRVPLMFKLSKKGAISCSNSNADFKLKLLDCNLAVSISSLLVITASTQMTASKITAVNVPTYQNARGSRNRVMSIWATIKFTKAKAEAVLNGVNFFSLEFLWKFLEFSFSGTFFSRYKLSFSTYIESRWF